MRYLKCPLLMGVVLVGIGVLLPSLAAACDCPQLCPTYPDCDVCCTGCCFPDIECLVACIAACDAQPVPVTLSSFKATVDDATVSLTWATGSETENLGYHVYRSLVKDGEYEKLTLELIEGAGSSRTTRTYDFIDQDVRPAQMYYYKLEQIDFDGTKTMHGPVAIAVTGGTAVQPTTWGLIKTLLK